MPGAVQLHRAANSIAATLSASASTTTYGTPSIHASRPFFLYFAAHDPHVPRVPHPRFLGKSGCGVRGDVIVEFDWCVGQIMATLDQFRLASNTLVILSSDNGETNNLHAAQPQRAKTMSDQLEATRARPTETSAS